MKALERIEDDLDQHNAQKPSEDESTLSELEAWEAERDRLEAKLKAAKAKKHIVKTKRHFLYYEIETKYSKTYGGRDYQLAIVEVVKRGEIKHLGRADKRCSRGHMGEESEAWSWIFHNVLTPRQKKEWLKATGSTNPKPWSVYFNFTAARELGYVLNQVGKLG